MKKTLVLMLSLSLLLVWFAAPQAATEAEIATAIENGLAWLATQQMPDGSWPPYYGNVAVTALALLKFEDRAYELGYDSPFDPAYPYHQTVIDGYDFLLDNSNGFFNNTAIGLQDHTAGASGNMDNPDANGNGIGVSVYGNSGIDLSTYETGCVLAAISASGTPTRLVNSPGSPIHGRQFQAIAQDMVEWLAWGQSDYHQGIPPCGEGGWTYGPLNNSGLQGGHFYGPDNSNSGYAVLGLAYADDFGCNIPGWVMTELNAYVGCIQDPVNGDPNDGGSWYDRMGDGIGVNCLKTGNLIFEMGMIGDTPGSARVQDALDYLERHWGDPSGANQPPGWNGTPAQYQSMFCIMKGLEFMGIDDVNGIDWFDEFTDAIVAQQIPQTDPDPTIRGAWLTSSGRGNPSIITAWALLTLEKISPEGECEGINLWIPNDIKVTPSENVYVPVYIQDVTGWGVMAFDIEICWCGIPAGLLQYEFCRPGEVMVSSGWADPVCGPCDPNCMSVSAAGATPLEGGGVLFYLKFHVSDNAKPCMCCDIWFTEVNLYDPEYPLQVCWEDGEVCVDWCEIDGYVYNWYCDYDCGKMYFTHPIEGARLNLSDCNGPIASTYSDAEGYYKFDCLWPKDPGCVYSHCVDIDYCEVPRRLITAFDASLVLRHLVCLDDLDDCMFHTCMTWAPQRVAADVNCSNVITAYDASLILQYVIGMIPAFPCPDPWVWFPSPCEACVYDCFNSIDFIGVLKGNVSGAPGPAPLAAPGETYVRLGRPRHFAGRVKVPVFVRDAEDIFSIELYVSFNDRSLELDCVVAAGLADGFTAVHKVTDGSIAVAMAGFESFSGDGRIATLTFQKKRTAPGIPAVSPKVSLNSVLFNEGIPEAIIEGIDYQEEIVKIGLGPVTPNPFAGSTVISYTVPAASHVSLSIYNVNGQLVRTVVDENVEAGVHRVAWDGKDRNENQVARGVYFCRMNAGEFRATEKIVVLK